MNSYDLAEMTALLKQRPDTAHMRVVAGCGTNDPSPGKLHSSGEYYEVFVDDDSNPNTPFSSIAEVYRWWSDERWHASWRQDGAYHKSDLSYDTPIQALREAIAAWRYDQKVNRQ